MFFKKDKNKIKNNFLIKVCALLIHAAKIDEQYTENEEKIIKKTLMELGIAKEDLLKTINEAIHSMSLLNRKAAEELKKLDVHAVTDVTGFGLLGHLKEMCENSKLSAEIYFSELNFLPSVIDLAEAGIIPGGTKRNFEHIKNYVKFGEGITNTQRLLMADAQTSGGLLISMSPRDAKIYVNSLYTDARIIGKISDKAPYLIQVS